MDVNEARPGKQREQQRDATAMRRVLDQQRTPATFEADLAEESCVQTMPQRPVRLVVEENAAIEELATALGEVQCMIEPQRRHLSERELVLVRTIGGHSDAVAVAVGRQAAFECWREQ